MDERIRIADAAAGAAFLGAPWLDMPEVYSEEADDWPLIGCPLAGPAGEVIQDDDHRVAVLCDRVDDLATFVRENPLAPLEAMYRHARSCGVHDRPSDGFDDVPAAFRIAYAVFRATLIEADRVFAEEEARAARKAAADKPQAPVLVRAEDTILEQHGTIFEKVDDPAPMVNLGGPVVATEASEGGENGEAAEMGEAAGAAAVDHGSPAAAASDLGLAGAVAGEAPRADGGAADPAPVGAAQGDGPAAAADDAGAKPVSGDAGPAGAADDAAGDDGAPAPVADADATGAQPADPAPEAPAADALEAQAKAVSPARRKR